MKIAILGWGSLCWDPRDLATSDPWMLDGLHLPIEFARMSNGKRLTLVIQPDFPGVTTLYIHSQLDTLAAARENLRVREDTPNMTNIGFIDFTNNTSHSRPENALIIPVLTAWNTSKNFDAIIWSDFEPRLNEAFGEFTLQNVIRFLTQLPDAAKRAALKYIRNAPQQIKTRFRQDIEQTFIKEDMNTLFQSERDAIAFLGLLSIAYRQFDFSFVHPDKETTHANGLNIFAAIVDNGNGEVLAQRQNKIHAHGNPLMHAEQQTLHDAIDAINRKRPRNFSTTSIENYYRKYLFNSAATGDYVKTGCTIYTTLEPCPYCASALLVTRMKRIVYIIPDKKFGKAFEQLKTAYYPTYDMSYEQLRIHPYDVSPMIQFAMVKYQALLTKVEEIKKAFPNMYDTLLLDHMNDLLRDTSAYFLSLKEEDIKTIGEEKNINLRSLQDFQEQK